MSLLLTYSKGSPLLKKYIEMNGIKSAFVCKADARVWEVYAGDAVTRQGFKEGVFKTQREALEYAGKLGEAIASVEK